MTCETQTILIRKKDDLLLVNQMQLRSNHDIRRLVNKNLMGKNGVLTKKKDGNDIVTQSS